MKRNKYEIILECCDETEIIELQGGRFTANRIYKICCKCANMIEDIYAVFLVKNDSVIKQHYAN